MTYLGIDQSLTSPGFAVLPAQGPTPLVLQAVKTGGRRGAERLSFIWAALRELLEEHKPVGAALEGYSIGSTNRSFDLGEVGGIVRLCLHAAEVPFVVVPPTSLKKFVTGSGAASKQSMRKATLRKWGLDIEQEDACDAYGLARVARGFFLQAEPDRAEMEVLKSLRDASDPLQFLASAGRP